jgi:hypothetical protein
LSVVDSENEPVTLRPLLVTRISALLFFGVLPLAALLYGVLDDSAAEPSEARTSPADVASDLLVFPLIGVFLYLGWRAWRNGITLTSTSIVLRGLLYDRTIPRRSVDDALKGLISWTDTRGRARVSIATAFLELGATLDFISTHNHRCMSLVRRHALGDAAPTLDDQPVDTSTVEDRAYDRSTTRRLRTAATGRRAGPRNHRADSWRTLLLLTVLIIGSVIGLWLTVEPALWLYGLSSGPGAARLLHSSDPYNTAQAWDTVTLLGPLTIIALGSAITLTYLILRPPLRK